MHSGQLVHGGAPITRGNNYPKDGNHSTKINISLMSSRINLFFLTISSLLGLLGLLGLLSLVTRVIRVTRLSVIKSGIPKFYFS